MRDRDRIRDLVTNFDIRIYLGPHIRCRIERAKEPYPGCLNDGCAKNRCPATGKHCKECGKKLGTFVVETGDESIAHWQLEDDLDLVSYLSCDEKYRLFIPKMGKGASRRRGGPRQMIYNPQHEIWYESFARSPRFGVDESRWFEKTFTEDIERVVVAYGAKNVDVVWGFFTFSVQT